MERRYLSEAHRKRSEALQKEVAEMSKHPYSLEQMRQQVQALKDGARKKNERAGSSD